MEQQAPSQLLLVLVALLPSAMAVTPSGTPPRLLLRAATQQPVPSAPLLISVARVVQALRAAVAAVVQALRAAQARTVVLAPVLPGVAVAVLVEVAPRRAAQALAVLAALAASRKTTPLAASVTADPALKGQAAADQAHRQLPTATALAALV